MRGHFGREGEGADARQVVGVRCQVSGVRCQMQRAETGGPASIPRMARPAALAPIYEHWAWQQKQLIETLRPLTQEQMQLSIPGAWAIWKLASNMAGGRLYWMCTMLGEDDRGLGNYFAVDHTTNGQAIEWGGWEDNEDRPRSADELIEAFEKTWTVIEAALDRWTLDDLAADVQAVDWRGNPRTLKRPGVITLLLTHEAHHGSEISLILRAHGLPTLLNA